MAGQTLARAAPQVRTWRRGAQFLRAGRVSRQRSNPWRSPCKARRSQPMHELAITQGIVEGVCEALPDKQILAVTVEIGRLSGVVADSVRFCFDLCAKGTPLEGARLEIVDVPGRGRCGSCQRELEVEELVASCPCGNPFLEILRGQELRIKSVEVP